MQMNSNLQVLPRGCLGGTKIETRFPFGDKVYPGMSLRRVGNNFRSDSSCPELTLLRTTPPVRMCQYKLDAVRNRVPAMFPELIGINKQRLRRVEEITHEIGKEIDNRLSLRKSLGHLGL